MWITESGVVLTDGDHSYSGHAITCTNAEADDNGSLGACVDGDPGAQQAGATEFLSLGANASYSPGQVTQVFWYQFQPTNADSGWDSGMVAPPAAPAGSWSQLSPDGIYGSNAAVTGVRSTFCVLVRLAGCSAGPIEDSDWSIQPKTVSGALLAGQTVVSSITGDQSWVANGAFVSGPGIPQGTRLVSGAGTGTWTLSSPATVTVSGSLIASG